MLPHRFIKLLKSEGKDVFLKTDIDIPIATTQLSQSGLTVIQSHFYTPKMTPKWYSSDFKVTLKWGQTHLLGEQNALQKRVFPVYGSTWVDKWRHNGRKMPPMWFKVAIICQLESKMAPKWRQSDPMWLRGFLKPLKDVGKMNTYGLETGLHIPKASTLLC